MQERRVADPVGEVLDQLEQRLLRPVDVLEDEHERLRVGELAGPLARGPGDLLLAALGLDRLEHARGEAEQVGDGLVLAADAQLLDAPPAAGSSSVIPAATFTISASGQYVIPSP